MREDRLRAKIKCKEQNRDGGYADPILHPNPDQISTIAYFIQHVYIIETTCEAYPCARAKRGSVSQFREAGKAENHKRVVEPLRSIRPPEGVPRPDIGGHDHSGQKWPSRNQAHVNFNPKQDVRGTVRHERPAKASTHTVNVKTSTFDHLRVTHRLHGSSRSNSSSTGGGSHASIAPPPRTALRRRPRRRATSTDLPPSERSGSLHEGRRSGGGGNAHGVQIGTENDRHSHERASISIGGSGTREQCYLAFLTRCVGQAPLAYFGGSTSAAGRGCLLLYLRINKHTTLQQRLGNTDIALPPKAKERVPQRTADIHYHETKKKTEQLRATFPIVSLLTHPKPRTTPRCQRAQP